MSDEEPKNSRFEVAPWVAGEALKESVINKAIEGLRTESDASSDKKPDASAEKKTVKTPEVATSGGMRVEKTGDAWADTSKTSSEGTKIETKVSPNLEKDLTEAKLDPKLTVDIKEKWYLSVFWDNLKKKEFSTGFGVLWLGVKDFFSNGMDRFKRFINKLLGHEALPVTDEDKKELPAITADIEAEIKATNSADDFSKERWAFKFEQDKLGAGFFYSWGKRIEIGRHPDDPTKFKVAWVDVAFSDWKECIMTANLSNKIVGMYQSNFAKAFVHGGKKLVLDEDALDWIVKTKSATISYEAGDGLIRESETPAITDLLGIFRKLTFLNLSEAKTSAERVIEMMREITLLNESTMQTKFPNLYAHRDGYAKFLHDEINTLDRKDWVDFFTRNYDYTAPRSASAV